MTASSSMALAMRLPASGSSGKSMNPSFRGSQSSFLGEGVAAGPCISVCRRRCFRVQAKIREIFMPALSSTMTEGKITSWVKAEGDKVSKGESVVVVESDKADMDVETFYDGILASIVVREGEVAAVGAPIGILAETEEEVEAAKAKYASGGRVDASPPASPAPAAGAPATAPVPVPAVAPAPVPAPIPALAIASAPSANASHPASLGGSRIVATPYAKKLAKDLKVDLSKVAGSGPFGRIVAADVEKVAAGPARNGAAAPPPPTKPAAVTASAPSPSPSPLPSPAVAPLDGDVHFTGMQAAVARNMVESLEVPVFRVGYTVTTDALDALYKKIKSKGVTMSALLAKAAALALVKHPVLNASCKNGNSFVYHSNINVAVAVAIDGGLITPVLQDADKIDIYSLSRKWKELVDKARAKQLQPAEYSTGTFTISNLGMFGVDRFDAILPPGTGAIMSVGASRPTVVATGGGLFGVKNQMQVNVTADHRIIYGADVAAFLQTLAKIIEDPTELTL